MRKMKTRRAKPAKRFSLAATSWKTRTSHIMSNRSAIIAPMKMSCCSSQSAQLTYTAWKRAALATIHCPITLKPHATIEANTVITTTVSSKLSSSASVFGMIVCSLFCSGQTIANMSSANASGAKIEAAK